MRKLTGRGGGGGGRDGVQERTEGAQQQGSATDSRQVTTSSCCSSLVCELRSLPTEKRLCLGVISSLWPLVLLTVDDSTAVFAGGPRRSCGRGFGKEKREVNA